MLGGVAYDTEGSVLVAGDDWFDGRTTDRKGKNHFLWRTPQGGFFLVAQEEGRPPRIRPLGRDEAIVLWNGLGRRRIEFAEAFPGVIAISG